MGSDRLTDEQVQQIIAAARGGLDHVCRFDDDEAKSFHALADALANGGLDNLRELLEFGATLRQVRKTGWAAVTALIIGAVFTALGLGIREWVKRG